MSTSLNVARLPVRGTYLAALERGVLIFDGAMGTNIQRHQLTAEDFGGKALEGCNDHLVLTRPDVIQDIHESFLAVGCDVVETCTFQSTPRRLAEWGLLEQTRTINVGAAQIARAACDRYTTPGRPRFVAASIGPTGMLPSSSDPALSRVTFGELRDDFYAQASYLVEGGVDVLLIETSQDILEVKAALAGFARLFRELGYRVPVQAQVTLDVSGRMLLGTDVASAMTTLEALGVDVIGLIRLGLDLDLEFFLAQPGRQHDLLRDDGRLRHRHDDMFGAGAALGDDLAHRLGNFVELLDLAVGDPALLETLGSKSLQHVLAAGRLLEFDQLDAGRADVEPDHRRMLAPHQHIQKAHVAIPPSAPRRALEC